MLACWQTEPESRPLFDKLEKIFTNILDDGIYEKYISMNEPYLLLNEIRLKSKNIDYASMLKNSNNEAAVIGATKSNTISKLPLIKHISFINNLIYQNATHGN